MNIISSSQLKSKALKLGFQNFGITRAISTPIEKANLEKWLEEGHHGSMEWIVKRKDERGDIFNYFPQAKSIISVGMNYFSGFKQEDMKSGYHISNYAWGDDYHKIMKSRLFELLGWLEKEIPGVKGVVCVDTSPVMDKVWAVKAGLGWQGKHTNLITRDYGSWIFLGELIVNIELDYNVPFIDDLCGSCTACIDSCPTNALGEYKIAAEKCISYLTIEHRNELPEDRSDLHCWIYGCDICQEVCPWNKKFSQITKNKEFYPKDEIISRTDQNWQALNDEEFRKLFKGSAVKRTKFSGFKRNINQNKEVI